MVGRGQLGLDLVEIAEKIDRRVHAAGDLGMGAKLDEILQRQAGAVQDRADLQTPRLAQPVGELEPAGRRRHARKNVVRDRPQ